MCGSGRSPRLRTGHGLKQRATSPEHRPYDPPACRLHWKVEARIVPFCPEPNTAEPTQVSLLFAIRRRARSVAPFRKIHPGIHANAQLRNPTICVYVENADSGESLLLLHLPLDHDVPIGHEISRLVSVESDSIRGLWFIRITELHRSGLFRKVDFGDCAA